jgi:hypothetical protein
MTTDQTTAEQDVTPAAPDNIPEREITFKGRSMWVRLPSPGALLVWERTIKKLQTLPDGGWNGQEVILALERARRIVDSLLVNKADIEWLDDQMLTDDIGLEETADIIKMTIKAFAPAEGEGNREDRRAAKKATPKKARRKVPTA